VEFDPCRVVACDRSRPVKQAIDGRAPVSVRRSETGAIFA
jgi:hypothetical protein